MSDITIHIRIPGELRPKLDEMTKTDRREKPDFIRLLIEDEWKRRTENGAKS